MQIKFALPGDMSMRTLRLFNYVGILLSVLILFNLPVTYRVQDLFLVAAVGTIIVAGGYVLSYRSGSKARFFHVLTSVLLVFSLVNLGYYYPGLNLVKHNIELTIEVQRQINGWILIMMVLFLIFSVLFSGILEYKKEDTKKYESNLYE